jgi:hypothetical protein
MTGKIDLKRLERKAYLSYHKDGLVDLFLGFAAITFGLFALTEMVVILAGSVVIWLSVYIAAKRLITVPRIGIVEFSPERKSKLFTLLWILVLVQILSVCVSLLAWMIPLVATLIILNHMIIIGLVGAGIFSIIAYMSDIQRFYWYGIVTLVAFLGSYFFNFTFYLPMMAVGILITATGLVLLVRFIQTYPISKEGEAADVGPET